MDHELDEETLARMAECDLLCERAQDPDDPYDGHHGTDRSPESLELARATDPETYARVTWKMANGL